MQHRAGRGCEARPDVLDDRPCRTSRDAQPTRQPLEILLLRSRESFVCHGLETGRRHEPGCGERVALEPRIAPKLWAAPHDAISRARCVPFANGTVASGARLGLASFLRGNQYVTARATLAILVPQGSLSGTLPSMSLGRSQSCRVCCSIEDEQELGGDLAAGRKTVEEHLQRRATRREGGVDHGQHRAGSIACEIAAASGPPGAGPARPHSAVPNRGASGERGPRRANQRRARPHRSRSVPPRAAGRATRPSVRSRMDRPTTPVHESAAYAAAFPIRYTAGSFAGAAAVRDASSRRSISGRPSWRSQPLATPPMRRPWPPTKMPTAGRVTQATESAKARAERAATSPGRP